MAGDLRRVTRALLSVSDKTGLVDLARALRAHGIALVSTGGTARALAAEGIEAADVSDLTGFPEMMDGRVKTLHPKVHGGLLAVRENPEHEAAMLAHAIAPIDLLVVNLYPFEATVAAGAAFEDCVETIDVGGPAMIRAGAKNHADVAVVVDPADYGRLLTALDANGGATPLDLRRALAAKAFARTAAYDGAIARRLAEGAEPAAEAARGGPERRLRYGENPHQQATLLADPSNPRPGIVTARQVGGKDLSYNNINDADAAYECVAEFDPAGAAAVAIIKHANPCGVALAETLAEAYDKALRCDPVSAFGGVVALNRPLDRATAERVVALFVEVVIAPDADEGALAVFRERKNVRLLLAGALPDPRARGLTLRSVAGGTLVQSRDDAAIADGDLKVVTRRVPTAPERADLLFAFKVAKHVKSNAIVYARDGATVGIGAGQMSRVDSARIAAWKALAAAEHAGLPESLARGAVVASDAFFPFADGLIAAAEAGATAVIQPGGSIRDDEVIRAADAAGLAMVFTGIRHFRH